jgi:hypothetical protein
MRLRLLNWYDDLKDWVTMFPMGMGFPGQMPWSCDSAVRNPFRYSTTQPITAILQLNVTQYLSSRKSHKLIHSKVGMYTKSSPF